MYKIIKRHFKAKFAEQQTKKVQIFDQNHGLTPLKNVQFPDFRK